MTRISTFGKKIIGTNSLLVDNFKKYTLYAYDNLPFPINYSIRFWDIKIEAHKDFSGFKYFIKMGLTDEWTSDYSPAECYDILRKVLGIGLVRVDNITFRTERGHKIKYLVTIDLRNYSFVQGSEQ